MDRIRHGSQKTDRQLGFADVTVINAKGLPKMDVRGLSDPYVVVLLENKDGRVVAKKRTRTIKQSLQPTWNDEFEFHVKNEEQVFHFRMFDHDLLGKDDLIGKVKIAVGDIVKGDWIDWFTLKDDDGDQIPDQAETAYPELQVVQVIGEDGTEATVQLSLRFTLLASEEEMALTRSIYDPAANEGDLKLAIRAASGTFPKKRVLLQLGSDWSLPCKRMFFLLFEDKSCKETIEQYYEYLLLDAEREQNFPILKKLGDPQYLGFPVFVIIDAYGRYIHSQATGDLEKDPAFMSHAGPDPKKILKFLMRWREDGMADKELGTLDPVQD